MADLFDNIIAWLLEQALGDDDISPIVQGLAQRLIDGGVPLARISIGRSIVHPTIGLIDMQWDRESGQVSVQSLSRDQVHAGIVNDEPFADISHGRVERIAANLKNPKDVARYPLFAKLADRGLTGYLAFGVPFGRTNKLYADIHEDFRGASLSFATKRFSGFSATDREGLERILPAIAVCLHVDMERFISGEILKTYLGSISGKLVLKGEVSRGDGQQIDCAIFYSDLRESVELSRRLDTQTYLDTINAYFDCTATAVDEHGGEVLKFIGDGVLAIFPFDDAKRPRANMCAAALASAQEAFARAEHVNAARAVANLPALQFGVGLHVGTVIHGNVGTTRRLDFTATGPAVGLASRCEGMTRVLDTPLIATAQFAEFCPSPSTDLGQHSLRGFGAPMTLVTYPMT